MAWSKVSRHKRGYGTAHDKARKLLLATEPLCRSCAAKGLATVATIADHIKPLSKGGTGSMDNMQPMCGPCHDAKTLTESADARGTTYKPKQEIGLDGWPK